MLAVIATIPVSGAPSAVALSPDGGHAYVANPTSATIAVIDTATNAVIDTIGPAFGLQVAQQLVMHPDGTKLYVNSVGAIIVVDVGTKAVVSIIPSGWAGQLTMHPDGSRLYLASGGDSNGNPDPKIIMIDTATNAVIGSIKVEDVYHVAVSPDGTRLYVTGHTGDTMWAIDTATHAVVSTIALGKPTSNFVVSHDSNHVYVLGTVKFGLTTSSVNVLDVAAGAFTAVVTFPLGMEPAAITVAPDGARIYVTNVHGWVSQYDAADLTVSGTVKVSDYAGAVAVSPNGSRIYVTNRHNDTVTVLAQLHSVVGNPDLPDLVGKLFGGAAAGGGGWLVIGDHFIPIPPRPEVLQALVHALGTQLGTPIKNHELGQRLRRSLARPH